MKSNDTIQPPQQQPDIEGNSSDGLGDASLPAGSVTDGMTSNVNPDGASTDTGYATVQIAGPMTDQREGDELGYAPTQTGGGVCGRPGGWER